MLISSACAGGCPVATVLVLGVALPGELWLVAGVLIWPLGAWIAAAVRGVAPAARWRTFSRAAAVGAVVAVALLGLMAYLFATNGTTRGFQALAAQIAAGVTLLGAVVCGLIALVLRRRTRDPERAQPHARR